MADHTEHDLRRQTEAAKTLLLGLREVGADDDEELLDSAIEGETDLLEAIEAALDRMDEEEILVAGIKAKAEQLAARKKAAEDRIGRFRTLIEQALAIASPSKALRLASATLSLGRRPRNAVIVQEADIPTRFFVPQEPPAPKLDKAELTKALRARAEALAALEKIEDPERRQAERQQVDREHPPIPGADLDNGGFSLSIRRR